jgi:type IV secretory pathway TrbD component
MAAAIKGALDLILMGASRLISMMSPYECAVLIFRWWLISLLSNGSLYACMDHTLLLRL